MLLCFLLQVTQIARQVKVQKWLLIEKKECGAYSIAADVSKTSLCLARLLCFISTKVSNGSLSVEAVTSKLCLRRCLIVKRHCGGTFRMLKHKVNTFCEFNLNICTYTCKLRKASYPTTCILGFYKH